MPYVGQTITDVFPTSINVDTATIATANISNQLTDANMSAGSAVQVVNVETGNVATTTTTVPIDDTIPQITEGAEFMTLAITPTSATNKLMIQVSVSVSSAATNSHVLSMLFVGTTANALAIMGSRDSAANMVVSQTFNHIVTAGATSELTFRVRCGMNTAGTFTFNGVNGSRNFGGALASSITITEIAV